MKKMSFFTGAICGLVALSSCLTSIQPLVTKNNITTESRFTGTWQRDNTTIKIEKLSATDLPGKLFSNYNKRKDLPSGEEKEEDALNARSYSMVFEKNGVTYYMQGMLAGIDGNLYLQLRPFYVNDPQEKDGSGYEFAFDQMPSYSIAKLHFDGNNALTIQFLNDDFIKEQITAGTMRIKHEHDNLFGSFAITASPDELQRFMEKYGNDNRLYSTKNSVTLKRIG